MNYRGGGWGYGQARSGRRGRRRRRMQWPRDAWGDRPSLDTGWTGQPSLDDMVCEGCFETIPLVEGFLADILREGNTQFLCGDCLEKGLGMGIITDYVTCGSLE